jgi:type VI secretion system secreted protein Hcp
MAVDMFLKLEGIDGESRDSKHKDEIDVLAFTWGASNFIDAAAGSGAGAGKVNFQDISFTTFVNAATSKLLFDLASGKSIASGILTLRKAGESPLEFLKIELTNCFVSSYSSGESSGEDRPTENFSLNFQKVHFTYTEQDLKGGPGTKHEMFWDLAANKGTGS